MLFQLRIFTICWLLLILNSQLVLADPPIFAEDANILGNGDIELEIVNEDQEFETELGVLIGFQEIFSFTSIKANLGYAHSNDLIIDRTFDNRFLYGFEIEFPIIRENFVVVSELSGELGLSDNEKPLLSQTGIVYEVNDQIAFDCGFEVGVNDAESSKAIILGIALSY